MRSTSSLGFSLATWYHTDEYFLPIFSDLFFPISERALHSDILGICTELLRAGCVAAAFTLWKRRNILIPNTSGECGKVQDPPIFSSVKK